MSSSNEATIGPFNWIIPVTSIISICVITLYTLPKQQYLGLFVVVWWGVAVLVSLNNTFLTSPTEWSEGDWFGVTLLSTWPVLVLGIIWALYRRIRSIRKTILEIPAWALIFLQVNRISGASVFYQYKVGGHLPKYIGVQTSILDIFIATTSIPLGLLVQKKGLHTEYVRDWAWFWHSVGLFDMLSAFGMRVMNFLGLGGEWISQPPVAVLLFHPFALIIIVPADTGSRHTSIFHLEYKRLRRSESEAVPEASHCYTGAIMNFYARNLCFLRRNESCTTMHAFCLSMCDRSGAGDETLTLAELMSLHNVRLW